MAGIAVDVAAVNGAGDSDGGVTHGGRLLALVEAIMRGESGDTERDRLRAVLSSEAFVDVAAVIGSFNVVDRIADATGIPLDAAMDAMSRDVRDELGLARFASAANTPPRAG
jgi:hypothetical protein